MLMTDSSKTRFRLESSRIDPVLDGRDSAGGSGRSGSETSSSGSVFVLSCTSSLGSSRGFACSMFTTLSTLPSSRRQPIFGNEAGAHWSVVGSDDIVTSRRGNALQQMGMVDATDDVVRCTTYQTLPNLTYSCYLILTCPCLRFKIVFL